MIVSIGVSVFLLDPGSGSASASGFLPDCPLASGSGSASGSGFPDRSPSASGSGFSSVSGFLQGRWSLRFYTPPFPPPHTHMHITHTHTPIPTKTLQKAPPPPSLTACESPLLHLVNAHAENSQLPGIQHEQRKRKGKLGGKGRKGNRVTKWEVVTSKWGGGRQKSMCNT